MEEGEVVMMPSDGKVSFAWSREMTLALIEEYKHYEKEFYNPLIRKNLLWKKISYNLKRRGFPSTNDYVCDNKWRNLKKTYRKELHKNNVTWAYYDVLKSIFGEDVDQTFTPRTKSKSVRNKEETLERMETIDLDSEEEPDINGFKSESLSEEESSDDSNDKSWMSGVLNEYQKWNEQKLAALSEMHSEVIALEERKTKLLSTLIEVFGNTYEDVSCLDTIE